ncbi:MAG: FGGY-family carbohydrate kinase [Bacteroides sp.]|nr:FGGY-family carbohydrate kinase [Bacteroides sp.]
MTDNIKEKIKNGKTYLGIEFGSTRIKAVLTDDSCIPAATGSYEWSSRLTDGYWSYPMQEIVLGLQGCYADIKRDVKEKYGLTLTDVGAMGISGMMHGYMPFDKDGALLTPFRTWRNTSTEQAADKLTELFGFNIPQRWSIAHLYQAILNGEEHVARISYITTLAVYIHYRLTGVFAAGVGEASGMFPTSGIGYNGEMLEKFRRLIADGSFKWDIEEILPKVMNAGEQCGTLTEEGARLLDTEGDLKAGIPLCPPEGDAGTGMVATDSVLPKTGNISGGTSIFSMLVLEKPLKGVYKEIDVVATPDGSDVAMVHCNNCCSELDAWVRTFHEFAQLTGFSVDRGELYGILYRHAMSGEVSGGGITAYNFLSGEPVAGVEKGRPMYFRSPDSELNLANFFRAELMSAVAALKIGADILFEKEKVKAERFAAHGGLFKVEGAADKLTANAMNVPLTVMTTAGEGGAWGMALLAAYMKDKGGSTLSGFLSERVFEKMEKRTVAPEEEGVKGFNEYMKRFKAGLGAEIKAAKA